MKINNKFKFFTLLLLFLLFPFISLYCEKWVGQAATYQLIEGEKTTSGDFFDKDSLAAACNGFRLGAEITIINPNNGKEITIIVNDRIKENSNYFILLTPKAAKELEFEWETGLVVIEANFSDVNSTERLAINGLVREGEIDLETLKKFPEINWPKDDKIITDKIPTIHEKEDYPEKEEKEIPEKDTKIAMIDTDEKNGYIEKEKDQYENVPEEEEKLTPEEKMKKYILSDDIDEKAEGKKEDIIVKEDQLPKKEDKIAMIPEEKKEKTELDTDTIDIEKKDKEVPDIITPPEELIWDKALIKGKIYIRISTAFNKVEGDRRLSLFKKIFPNVIGVESEGKYIIYIGPVPDNKIDVYLNNIRKYGFKDAYIIKS